VAQLGPEGEQAALYYSGQEVRRSSVTMLAVQDSLSHIHTRKLLIPLEEKVNQESQDDKEICGHSGLGSDGETSDYQRSTPSPRDSAQRITELGSEGCLEKEQMSPPDLGFVDFTDNSNSSLTISNFHTSSSSTSTMPNFPNTCIDYGSYRDPVEPVKEITSSNKSDVSPNPLLNKQLKVEIERLPSVMASVVNGDTVTSNIGQKKGAIDPVRRERKQYMLADTNNIKRTNSSTDISSVSDSSKLLNKKCPNFVAGRQKYSDRKSGASYKTFPSNSGVRRTKEILLTPNLFNSFRITKPKQSLHCNNKSEASNVAISSSDSLNFEPDSFYKCSSSSLSVNSSNASNCVSSPKVNKHTSDLIVSSTYTTPNPRLSSLKKSERSTGLTANPIDSSHRICETKLQSRNASDSFKPLVTTSSLSKADDRSPTCSTVPNSITDSSANKDEYNEAVFDDDTFALPRKLRFPASEGSQSSGSIPCKWDGCHLVFKAHGKLSDHIKTEHVVAQLECDNGRYSCLWSGCKVYGKSSSSKGWLEKHVPLHGGKFAFSCIVEGCKSRFSTQAMLERHVNSHFEETGSGASSTNTNQPRKSIEGAPARKRLKRAGVKLKFRQLPFSARIFDFFDTGIMSGIRHQVASIDLDSKTEFNLHNDCIEFRSKVITQRTNLSGIKEVHLTWIPENFLPDEWVLPEDVEPTKTVKISSLPEISKARLSEELLYKQNRQKQRRKTKWIPPYSPFLTPDEINELYMQQDNIY